MPRIGFLHRIHAECTNRIGALLPRREPLGPATPPQRRFDAVDELVEAERSARSAVAAAEELGDPYEQAAALVALGDCQAALGEETAARESWSTALVHLESVGSPNTEQVRQRLAARV